MDRRQMTDPGPQGVKKSLDLRQSWFLGVMAAVVVLMFSFVILPYVDPPAAKFSGQEAADFDLSLISGGGPGDRVRLSDLRGKVVILDFWASWCQPCREQSEVLSRIAPGLGASTVVLGIATSDREVSARAFLEADAPPYSNAFDEGGLVAQGYRVTQLPTLVLIDKSGTIRSVGSRIYSEDEILALLKTVGG
jgi:cytochrome c biogenesis protein CcmG/thiol:disulfide interchange protein DsbE